jgi:hypothetical protein
MSTHDKTALVVYAVAAVVAFIVVMVMVALP